MRLVLSTLVPFILLLQSAWADNVTDAIDQATTLYNDGQTQQAISQLDFAAQLIRQQRGQDLMEFLPDPLDDWTADDATNSSAGAAMFGGGTSVERTYQNSGSSVTAKILTDSPMMQAMMMMFSNPIMLTAQGGTLQMINGQQAIVKPDGVTMVVNNTYLITVDGNAQQADFVAYAGAIDFVGLKAF